MKNHPIFPLTGAVSPFISYIVNKSKIFSLIPTFSFHLTTLITQFDISLDP